MKPHFKTNHIIFKYQNSTHKSNMQQKFGTVVSWAVRGRMGLLGKPIRVRLGKRLDLFLGVKLASLCKERTCTS